MRWIATNGVYKGSDSSLYPSLETANLYRLKFRGHQIAALDEGKLTVGHWHVPLPVEPALLSWLVAGDVVSVETDTVWRVGRNKQFSARAQESGLCCRVSTFSRITQTGFRAQGPGWLGRPHAVGGMLKP